MMRILRPGDDVHIAAVIPAFNVGSHIGEVLGEMPKQIRTVIVVDDGSTDDTAAVVEQCAATDRRIHLIRHDRNRGIGAAMVTGFARSLELNAAVVVKIDGDGQMPLSMLPKLIHPLILGDADYAKGNRFRDFQAIRKMPPLRRFGNVVLSFLAKAATGYWHCFDPTNGFVAIRSSVLSQLPLQRIDPTYFFEISILSHLYLLGAVVKEEPMPARYQGEPSNLSIPVVVRDFPLRLFKVFIRRIVLKNFLYDFSVETLEIAAGAILLFAGTLYGGYNWLWYALHRLAAPTGTVVLSALMIMLGFQLLLSAIALDLQSVPRQPINEGSLVKKPRIDGTG
jgi:glycosyltransferase involved in cell wall biosynthesis